MNADNIVKCKDCAYCSRRFIFINSTYNPDLDKYVNKQCGHLMCLLRSTDNNYYVVTEEHTCPDALRNKLDKSYQFY